MKYQVTQPPEKEKPSQVAAYTTSEKNICLTFALHPKQRLKTEKKSNSHAHYISGQPERALEISSILPQHRKKNTKSQSQLRKLWRCQKNTEQGTRDLKKKGRISVALPSAILQ